MQEESAETSQNAATARKLVARFYWLIFMQEEGAETSQNAATGHKLVDRPWFDLTRVWKDQTKVNKSRFFVNTYVEQQEVYSA
jgi:hypothetical protein